MTPKYRHTHIVLICFLALLVSTCGVRQTADEQPSDSDEKSFDRLISASSEKLQTSTGHELVSSVLSELVRAATKEEWAQNRNPAKAIMTRYPDDRVSLALLDQELDAIKSEDPYKVPAFLQDIIGATADSRLAAKCLQYQLRLDLGESSEKFLSTCQAFIEEHSRPRVARVALYERLSYYRSIDNDRLAAQDTLRFCASYPDTIRKMGIQQTLAGYLRQAGFFMEAALLEQESEFGPLFQSLQRMRVASSDSTANSVDLLSKTYFICAPDTEAMWDRSIDANAAPEQTLLFSARLTKIALSQLQHEKALTYSTTYANTLVAVAKSENIDSDFAAIFPHVHAELERSFTRAYQDRSLVRLTSRQQSESDLLPRLIEIASTINWNSIPVFIRLKSPEPDQMNNVYAELILNRVEQLSKLGNRRDVLESYRFFVERFPSSNHTPKLLLDLGDYYADELESPRQAISTYEDLSSSYSGSRHASTAVIKMGRTLMAELRYEEAYDAINRFLEKQTVDQDIQSVAQILLAICESQMGFIQVGIDRMSRFERDHPMSKEAPLALLWLARFRIEIDDEEGARVHIQQLRERYPNSIHTDEARRLLPRESTE